MPTKTRIDILEIVLEKTRLNHPIVLKENWNKMIEIFNSVRKEQEQENDFRRLLVQFISVATNVDKNNQK